MRGAWKGDLTGANARNLIREDGSISQLELGNGESLTVRDYDGDTDRNVPPIGIEINDSFSMADGILNMLFEADPWDSTIAFAQGTPVLLGGVLQLGFASGVSVESQIGRTYRVFDWTGVEPTGNFAVLSRYSWDVSKLYSTGDVTLRLTGDTNDDGTVNIEDLNNVRNNFLGTGLGDTDGNGTVDIADLNHVRNGFGTTAPAAVPEPCTLVLLSISVVGFVVRDRR